MSVTAKWGFGDIAIDIWGYNSQSLSWCKLDSNTHLIS